MYCFRFYIFTVPETLFDMESLKKIKTTFIVWGMGEAVCHHVLQEENVQKLIHSTDLHFDLVVIETFLRNVTWDSITNSKRP
jgi:hypothetical protein